MIENSELLQVLSRHIGRENAVSAAQLVVELKSKFSVQTNERDLRLHVLNLRKSGHHICAHPAHGYFIAANDADLSETCEFLYSRAMTSLQQIAAMKRVSIPDLRGQLKLPS